MGMHGRAGGPGRMLDRSKDAKLTRPVLVLVKSLIGFLEGVTGLFVIATLISLIYAITQIINPLILSKGLDIFANIIYDGDGIAYIKILDFYTTVTKGIIALTLTFAVFATIGFFLNSISTRFLYKANAVLVNNIRTKLYSKLINSSMDYLKNEQSGNITARITSDTDQIATGIHLFTTIAIQLVILVATFVLLLVQTSWQIILICIGSVPLALLVSAILSQFGRRIILKIRQAFGIVSSKMAESFSGIAVSKSFNREETLSRQMAESNQEHYKMSQKFGLMMNVTMPLISAIASITIAMILWAGGLIDLTVGEIFLGVILSSQFLRPITFLSLAFPQIQASLGSVDRIVDVMEAAPSIEDAKDAVELKEDYSVSFENVSFAYVKDNYVLKNITFDVNDGEMIALVGETGAGKTTLASMLLPRFYDVQKGSIKVGGKDIREYTQESLRGAIRLIPQEPSLFSASVTDNIRYGKPDATEEQIHEISKLIGADVFIEALPDGYNTLVKEGGKQLSAGQRQMITIARTMLSDPKILILDEATSRLDAYSESLVQLAQRKLFENRTTFVIAHRLSTIHNAEKIVVLDHGELEEIGSHDELMEKDGIYADLYNTYYSFQGLESINLDEIDTEDVEEEVELNPMQLMRTNPEKFHKLVKEGKITPEQLEKIKKKAKEMGGAGMSGGNNPHK
ncbi:MAG: ABC transporter ATP-binding protein [Candidatus Heimdallarchaeota archaeon]